LEKKKIIKVKSLRNRPQKVIFLKDVRQIKQRVYETLGVISNGSKIIEHCLFVQNFILAVPIS
jgi:hypothetical protein